MKLRDDVCATCCNKDICKNLCPPLIWINGRTARREPLIQDFKNPFLESKDYNQTLAEKIDDMQSRFEFVAEIKDEKIRAIASMLAVGTRQKTIASLLFMSPRQIIRIIKQNKSLSTIKHVKMS
jgi:hypothetical protein